MQNLKLLKTWKAIETILKRAESAIPAPKPEDKQEFEKLKKEFNKYLDHNELELAMDMLEELGTIVNCKDRFWRDMHRAAGLMDLCDRAKVFKLKIEEVLREEKNDGDNK